MNWHSKPQIMFYTNPFAMLCTKSISTPLPPPSSFSASIWTIHASTKHPMWVLKMGAVEHDTLFSHILSPLLHLLGKSLPDSCPTLSCPSSYVLSRSRAAENAHRACRPVGPHLTCGARSRPSGHRLTSTFFTAISWVPLSQREKKSLEEIQGGVEDHGMLCWISWRWMQLWCLAK
jgi:hypothetical protein